MLGCTTVTSPCGSSRVWRRATSRMRPRLTQGRAARRHGPEPAALAAHEPRVHQETVRGRNPEAEPAHAAQVRGLGEHRLLRHAPGRAGATESRSAAGRAGTASLEHHTSGSKSAMGHSLGGGRRTPRRRQADDRPQSRARQGSPGTRDRCRGGGRSRSSRAPRRSPRSRTRVPVADGQRHPAFASAARAAITATGTKHTNAGTTSGTGGNAMANNGRSPEPPHSWAR